LLVLRRRLKDALAALETGAVLPGLSPTSQRVRPTALLLPTDVGFEEGARDALVARA
jgi:hypothetical protein